MHLSYAREQVALSRQLREYFAELMTPERRAALETEGPSRPGAGEDRGGSGEFGDGTAYRDVIRRLGTDGWLALSWPKEYGGQGRSQLDQLVFTDEATLAGSRCRSSP